MSLMGFVFGFIFVAAFSAIAFLIHPVAGVLLMLWLTGVAIYTIRKNMRR